ncbi:MAG: hypothetical protein WD016_08385 [Balneolaceae bacterium]
MPEEKIFDFNSSEYKKFLKKFRTQENKKHSLIVFAGEFSANRNYAIDELKRETMGEPVEIDLMHIITQHEEESYANIDSAISEISKDAPLIIFKNGQQLNGAYTGYTNSLVIYSTPQEKYFLEKVKEISAPVVLELNSTSQVDNTIVRKADAVVSFNAPSSFFENIAWKLQNMHVHGSRFLSPRPFVK